MPRPRFALLVGGTTLEPWHVACLDRLDGAATLSALIVAPELPRRPGGTSRGLRRYARRADEERIDAAPRLAGLPRVGPVESDLPPVDAVLRLGAVAIPSGLRPKNGIWWFPHEDLEHGPAFLAEVYDGADVTRVALACTDADGTTRVLDEAYLPTAKRSYPANRALALGLASQMPGRAAERLGSGISLRTTSPPADAPPARPRRLVPFVVALARRRLSLAWTRLFRHPQWNVGILRTPVGELIRSGYRDGDVEWFPLRGRRAFLADPFGVATGDAVTILCERYSYRDSKGHIAALERSSSGFVERVQPAIELGSHMSYPSLVADGSALYCVPETSDDGDVVALPAVQFPDEWGPPSVLIPGFPGVDPTIFRHEGRWWLLAGRKGPYEDVELHVWHADELTGPWRQHAGNPVKSDVRGSRPAGAPFMHDGVLYRPAQDCSQTYGGRITLQRILRLAPTEFREEQVCVIEARADADLPIGPHTLTVLDDDLALVDARRTAFVWGAFVSFLGIWARGAAARVRRA